MRLPQGGGNRIGSVPMTSRASEQVTMPDRAPYLTPLKTAASVAVVPRPEVVVDALAAHLGAWPTDGLRCTTEIGEPIRRMAFSERVWRPAVE